MQGVELNQSKTITGRPATHGPFYAYKQYEILPECPLVVRPWVACYSAVTTLRLFLFKGGEYMIEETLKTVGGETGANNRTKKRNTCNWNRCVSSNRLDYRGFKIAEISSLWLEKCWRISWVPRSSRGSFRTKHQAAWRGSGRVERIYFHAAISLQ